MTELGHRSVLKAGAAAGLGLLAAPALAGCGSGSARAVTTGPVRTSLWTHDPGYIKTFKSAVGDRTLMSGSRFDYRMRITNASGSDIVTRMMALRDDDPERAAEFDREIETEDGDRIRLSPAVYPLLAPDMSASVLSAVMNLLVERSSSSGTTSTSTKLPACGSSPKPGTRRPAALRTRSQPPRRRWSLLRRGRLSNVAFSTPEYLVQRIRRGLRHIQYRSHLIGGCLAGQSAFCLFSQPSGGPSREGARLVGSLS